MLLWIKNFFLKSSQKSLTGTGKTIPDQPTAAKAAVGITTESTPSTPTLTESKQQIAPMDNSPSSTKTTGRAKKAATGIAKSSSTKTKKS